MAYFPSPQLSPRTATAGNSVALKHERAMTPSLLAQPVSKRDKRRTVLAEKLNELTSAFSQNRDSHYRQQLQALQADMNLIMRADPYQDQPLDDSADAIADLISEILSGNPHSTVNGELAATSGRRYARFVEQVNNAMEDRDAQMTTLHTQYEQAMQKLKVNTQYKIRFAEEEERLLSGTLRERLRQTLGYRKARLMRDKEHLEISESNALLLHPSQFSIANPLGSPGGAQSNRKTRNTRQRPGDGDDVGGTYPAGEGRDRRKRKAAPEEPDADAPLSKYRAVEGGAGSPHRESRARLVESQLPPLYSVETLFTEKELTFNLNAAAVATAQYFSDLKARVYGLKLKDKDKDKENQPDVANGTSTNGAERKDGPASGGEGSAPEGEGAEESTPAAVEMDRATNQSHHATRSTRQGINILGDVNIVQRITAYGLTAPIILPASSTKTSAAPPQLSMATEELEDDLKKIERMLRGPQDATDEKLLESVCCEMMEWQALQEGLPPVELPSFDSALLNLEPPSSTLPPADDIPMSRQSSQADAASDVGGAVPMSRNGGGSSMGAGTAMRRTVSWTGGGGGSRRNRERKGR